MKSLFLLSMALVVAGCIHAPIRPQADPHLPSQIHVDSHELRRNTAVGTPITALNESGLLVVTVPIRSVVHETLYVDSRVTFFDRNGTVIGQPFKLQTKTLLPQTPDQIQFASPSRDAADFQLDLWFAR
jgi:hypothetical protein